MRRSTKIRQYLVTVRGMPCLVTSGDTVDRATYQALMELGAVVPWPAASGGKPEQVNVTAKDIAPKDCEV